ncbi:MAG: TetR/AcrR family transcriptional regulator [Cyclobacteriaceae bacterium]|nr:TetR/AcrR family transcriptional regulator [Cyclobacteriaceae bacterium]
MPTKREINAARIKYESLKYVLEECKSRSFAKIQVVEICKHVGISKVTFFKYFTSKADLLLYYRSILTLNLILKLTESGLEGMKALNIIVQHFANEYTQRPSMILGLIHYFTDSTIYVSPIAVKPPERLLFFPASAKLTYEVISFDQLIEHQMLDVVFKKQTTLSVNSQQLSEVFLSTLYGAIVLCRMRKVDHVSLFFFQILGTVFPGIKG